MCITNLPAAAMQGRAYDRGRASRVGLWGSHDLLQWVVGLQLQQWHRLFRGDRGCCIMCPVSSCWSMVGLRVELLSFSRSHENRCQVQILHAIEQHIQFVITRAQTERNLCHSAPCLSPAHTVLQLDTASAARMC